MVKNNMYEIEGVVYAKPVRTAPDTKNKNGGVPYEFPSIILELKRTYKEKVYVELPEFELGRGVNMDDYAIGDTVIITFSLSGKKVSDTWHKTVAKAIYIRFADIDSKKHTVGGESPDEVRQREKAKNDLFLPPSPLEDDEKDDLPF